MLDWGAGLQVLAVWAVGVGAIYLIMWWRRKRRGGPPPPSGPAGT